MRVKSLKATFILALSLALASTTLRGGLPPAQAQPDSPGPPLALSEPAIEQGPLDLPAEAPAGWWATVQEDIRQSEYHVTWQDQTYLADLPAAYQAPNRAHNLRTYFTADASSAGIRVIPRTGDTPSWQWGLTLTGYGYAGDLRPVAAAELVAEGNRIEYRRGGPAQDLTEWYVNDERGLEQGFTLTAPPQSEIPAPESEIILELALTGDLTPRLTEGGTAIEFTTPGGVRVLRYSDLYAYDATGRPLPAHLQLVPSGDSAGRTEHGTRADRRSDMQYAICIVVDDTQATYPITVDPLATSHDWTAESNQAESRFGFSVGTAGDVNGDGYADVIIGAPYYDRGQTDEGWVYVYHGSASGLSRAAAWTAESNQADAWFGQSVGTAGDVNGDGCGDVIVGAQGYDNGESDEGAAFVYHGSEEEGLGPDGGTPLNADWTAEGDQAEAHFGDSVGTAGDVNGDGHADLVVGAPWYDGGQWLGKGRATVYHGSASGLSTTAAWTAEGDQAYAWFGRSVGTAGDVNGDGYADLVVGASQYDGGQGRAYVYTGTVSGLGTTPAWTAEGDQAYAWFGRSVGTAGDVNGDGYADLVVGAPGYYGGPGYEGRAYVWYGSDNGLGNPQKADWTAEGDQYGWFGHSVGTAGDVNGDGYADLVVGAPLYEYSGQAWGKGRATVYHGSASGLSTTAAWAAEGDQAIASLGDSVGTAGDVNGDGYADLVVGAPYYDGGQGYEGRATVYHGSPSGLSTTAGWIAEGDKAGAEFSESLNTAGDVNGDGYADVIIGAPFYDGGQDKEGRAYVWYGSDNGLGNPQKADWTAESDQAGAHFGHSVSTAGDVNGDGYADVIVGAPGFDVTSVVTDSGQAYVFHGSISGLSETPNWTADGGQAGAEFGRSVGTAGDVNGDGYGDVIVGAPRYDNSKPDEGRAIVYYGSTSGLSAYTALTAKSNQNGIAFGHSVGTSGDVNGDGYTDIIVGAPLYDSDDYVDGGRAYVYYGSASGLSPIADWGENGDNAGEQFGWSVGTAGDVNGDGYADLVVGAPHLDDNGSDAGQAYVYYGRSSDPSTADFWTAVGEHAGDHFGRSVATAGDVNGDSYADVIVGAHLFENGSLVNEGKAYVWYGHLEGLGDPQKADWTAESDQSDTDFGFAVGSAGDVNGDGYADVMVGAPYYDGGQKDEGRASLYYGNGGLGLSLNPRQRRSDDSAPIAHLGQSADNTFRLAILGRTPFGRGKVKLEWEINPLDPSIVVSRTGQSSTWIDTGTVGVEINERVGTLLPDTPYHWRVRLLYRPATSPFQQYSRWLTMPWNGWNEQDLRAGPLAVAFDAATYSVSEADGRMTIPVVVYSPYSETITVHYATSNGTAQASSDYIATSGTLTFPAQVTERSFDVSILDDKRYEEDETLLLTLSDAHGAAIAGTNPVTLTILNDDWFAYLPLVLRTHRTWDAYYEDNNKWTDAYGPLVSGRTYRAYPNDTEDYYYFVLPSHAEVTVRVDNYAPTGPDNGTVLLYGPSDGSGPGPLIGHYTGPNGESMSLAHELEESGRYYVRVYTASSYSNTALYSLTVTY